MSTTLIEVASVPVELILCSEFHEGPVTGLLRAPGLASVLPGTTELVYGPARRAWKGETSSERLFMAAPAPAGMSQQLLDACPWPERWRSAPVYDVSTDNLPVAIADLLRPFKPDASKSAPFLARFGKEWTTLRLWRAPDSSMLDHAAALAFAA